MLETGYSFSGIWSNDLEVDNLIQESENYSLQSPGEPCSTLTFEWYICVHPHKKVKLFRCFTKIKKVILTSTKNTTIQKNILLNAAIGPGPTWNEKYVTFKYKPHRSLTTGSQHLRFYLIYRWKKESMFITALQAVIQKYRSIILNKTFAEFFTCWQFLFATCETELDYYHQRSVATCSLPTSQKTWLRTWGSWIWWRGPSWPPKRQILTFVVENHNKSAGKHSTDIPIVLNFVNLIVFLILDTITADYWR